MCIAIFSLRFVEYISCKSRSEKPIDSEYDNRRSTSKNQLAWFNEMLELLIQ